MLTMAVTLALGVCAVSLLRNDRWFSFAKSSPTLHTSPQNDGSRIEDEEYAVYSALINESTGDDNKDRLLVIQEEPSPWVGITGEELDRVYEALESSPNVMPETVYDLRAKVREHRNFARHFDIKWRYVLVSGKELEEIFQDGGGSWDKFYKEYLGSKGITTLSRVGFNSDRTQALVYVGYGCGGLCGGGGYLLFVKTNGVWVNKGGVGGAWIS